MENKPIVCVDFDGVIHSYTSGWKGSDVISDPPVPGAIWWLHAMTQEFTVHIYSSRSKEVKGRDAMKRWVFQQAQDQMGTAEAVELLQMLTFSNEKPAALLTIDDRCIQFNGDFSNQDYNPVFLKDFRPWNKKGDKVSG